MKRRNLIPKEAKKVFSGIIFDTYQWEQKLYDGSTQTFEMIKRPDTVIILPTRANQRLILIVNEQPTKKAHITFPGGRADKDSSLINEAKRELLEETGLKPKKIKFWKSFRPENKIDWLVYFFIAKECEQATEIHSDPGERIQLKEFSFDEFLELVAGRKYNFNSLLYEFLRSYYDKEYKEKIRKILFD